jgi:hypothetical protein
MPSQEAFARLETLSGIERGRFTPQLEFRRIHVYRPTTVLLPSLYLRHSFIDLEKPSPSPSPVLASTFTMDAIQLTDRLDRLTCNFAQYRVEMAFRIDSLERGLASTKGYTMRSCGPEVAPHLRPLPPVPRSASPGFAKHRRHPRLPPRIYATYDLSPQFLRTAYPGTLHGNPKQPSHGGFSLAKKAGSSENTNLTIYTGENRSCCAEEELTRPSYLVCYLQPPSFIS